MRFLILYMTQLVNVCYLLVTGSTPAVRCRTKPWWSAAWQGTGTRSGPRSTVRDAASEGIGIPISLLLSQQQQQHFYLQVSTNTYSRTQQAVSSDVMLHLPPPAPNYCHLAGRTVMNPGAIADRHAGGHSVTFPSMDRFVHI